jgi:hypothetical protein
MHSAVEEPFTSRLSRLCSRLQDQAMCSETQPPKEKNAFVEYQIDYNCERNSICVKLIMSTIAYSTESIDYIMFQSNILTFESANISL